MGHRPGEQIVTTTITTCFLRKQAAHEGSEPKLHAETRYFAMTSDMPRFPAMLTSLSERHRMMSDSMTQTISAKMEIEEHPSFAALTDSSIQSSSG